MKNQIEYKVINGQVYERSKTYHHTPKPKKRKAPTKEQGGFGMLLVIVAIFSIMIAIWIKNT